MTRQKLLLLIFTHSLNHQIMNLWITIYFSLQKTLLKNECIKNFQRQFFVKKDKKLLEIKIINLPTRWQKIVKQNISFNKVNI